jgi:DNA-binding SARP family transcriptional activator
MTRFAVLGPLEVFDESGPVEVRGTLRRTLLAALLINHDTVVSVDRLGDLLWGPSAPANTAASLHNQVTRLRRSLGAAGVRVRSQASGYRIHLDPGELDLTEFLERTTAGREASRASAWAEAARAYAAALELWRDRPLSDVAVLEDHPLVHHLGDEHLRALHGRIDAELHLGRHGEVIGELRGLVQRHPLDEAFHGQLMLALYRAGRPAAALEIYRALRRTLVDEVGIEPGSPVTELHDRILNADPALTVVQAPPTQPMSLSKQPTSLPGVVPAPLVVSARACPRQLPTDTRAFTGRSAEVDELLALGHRSAGDAGAGAVVISSISGMGGVGKTALAVHAAHRLKEHYPDGQLFIDLHGYSADLVPTAPEAALDYLLRSLGIPAHAIPEEPAERTALYRSLLANSRTLLVLDNAADSAQVRALLPASATCLVLVTSRNRLTSLDDTHLVALDPLSEVDALALLRAAAGAGRLSEDDQADAQTGDQTDDEAARQLVELCGRIPLAIRIAAARLRHRPALTVSVLVSELRDERDRLERLSDGDRDLSAVFGTSLSLLAERERRLFRLLGLVPGPDFDTYAAANLAGVGKREAERLLETLFDHNLLIQHTIGRYRLHDLLRAYALGLVAADPERQSALDRLLDFYLATTRAADKLTGQRHRRHFENERQAVECKPSIETLDDAREWLNGERANLLAAVGHRDVRPRQRIALIGALTQYFADDGPWRLAADLQREAIDAARVSRDLLSEANALVELAYLLAKMGDGEVAVRHAESALGIFRALGDRLGEAYALSTLGQAHFAQTSFPAAVTAWAEALEVHEDIGQRRAAGMVLFNLGLVYYCESRLDEAEDHLTRAMHTMVELGDKHGEANCLAYCGAVLIARGEMDEGRRMLSRGLEVFRLVGYRQGEANCLNSLGDWHTTAGEYDTARVMVDSALNIHRELGFPLGEAYSWWMLGRIALARGENSFALKCLDEALGIYRRIRYTGYEVGTMLDIVRVHRGTGDLKAATSTMDQLLDLRQQSSNPTDKVEVQLESAALTAEVEGPARALGLYRGAVDAAVAAGFRLMLGRALEGLGRCELRVGQGRVGLEHLTRAVDVFRDMGVADYRPAAQYLAEVAST